VVMSQPEPNILAYLALVVWFPVAWIVFALFRPPVATAATVLGGVMFLPEVLAIDAPLIPPFDKLVIAPLAALTGALWAARRRLARAKPYRGIDLVFIALILVNVGTILTNQDEITYHTTVLPALTTHDLLSSIARDHLSIFVPFLLGRAIFQKPQDLVDFVKVFALAGLVYSLLCLWEVRMSPQLHNWTYGYHQHSFVQTLRGGGYRPMVYMSHGISVARFMFGALLAMAALSRARMRLLNSKPGWFVFYLSVVLLLCKSTGAIVFAAGCLPLVLFASPKAQVRASFALALVVITFPILRATDIFPTDTLVEWGEEVSEERASSLGGRFVNEDMLLEKRVEPVGVVNLLISGLRDGVLFESFSARWVDTESYAPWPDDVLEAIYGYWSAVAFCPLARACAIISAAWRTSPHASRPLALKCETCTGSPARRPISSAS
jgi:hypothetical protein